MYLRNRFFLLSSLALSFFLPLFSFRIEGSGPISYLGKTLSDIIISSGNRSSVHPLQLNFNNSILCVYLCGAGVMLIKLTYDIFYLLNLVYQQYTGGKKVIQLEGFKTSGFSALGFIFLNKSISGKEMEDIIMHEEAHLRYKHYLDILFIGLIKVFQWFNPIIYLADRSLRSVHEYQTDESLLVNGVSVNRYQTLLFNHVLQTKIFLSSNTFSNPTLLKKRMIMMTKKRSKRLADLKLLLVLPVAAITMAFIAACGASKHTSGSQTSTVSSNETLPSDVYVVVEEMPAYPGGDNSLMEFVYKNIVYPKEAKDKNIQGRVICRFTVKTDGTVNNVSVLHGVDPSLDNEAIRVLKLLSGWKPGMQGGKPVNVWYSVPITFTLK
jgi:TonB family protein